MDCARVRGRNCNATLCKRITSGVLILLCTHGWYLMLWQLLKPSVIAMKIFLNPQLDVRRMVNDIHSYLDFIDSYTYFFTRCKIAFLRQLKFLTFSTSSRFMRIMFDGQYMCLIWLVLFFCCVCFIVSDFFQNPNILITNLNCFICRELSSPWGSF